MSWRTSLPFLPSRPSHRQTGYTLVELMLVLALGLTLATMAGPNLRGLLERTAERQALSQPLEFLRDAQSRARSQLVPVTVSISEAGFTRTDSRGGSVTVPFDARLYSVSIQTVTGQLRFNA